jgi:ABC-2 type transport system ATP-binding protein
VTLLEVSGLSAGYGGPRVLDGIDLSVERGEWVGVLGANGAGKSTLIRSLLAVVPSLSGRVMVDGLDTAEQPEAVRRRVGYAIPPDQLPRGVTIAQLLTLNARLNGYAINPEELDRWTDLLGLGPWMDVLIDACSFGTQQKAAIIAAVLQPRPLLIFDESFNGLDPVVSIALKRTLEARVRSGDCAILLATHMIDVVRSVCSRMVIIRDGAIQADLAGDAFQALREDRAACEDFVVSHMS